MNLHAYHDSGACQTADLESYRAKAQKQDDAILNLFENAHPEWKGSPSLVHEFFPQWPLTSIRRSLTNLTARGFLEKLSETVTGGYGRPEHYWRLARGQARLI